VSPHAPTLHTIIVFSLLSGAQQGKLKLVSVVRPPDIVTHRTRTVDIEERVGTTPEVPLPTQTREPGKRHQGPDPRATLKWYVGRLLDRIKGYTWWLLTVPVVGAGSTIAWIFNFFLHGDGGKHLLYLLVLRPEDDKFGPTL